VDLLIVELTKVIMSIAMFVISIVKQMSWQMSPEKFFLRAVHSYLCKIAVQIQTEGVGLH